MPISVHESVTQRERQVSMLEVLADACIASGERAALGQYCARNNSKGSHGEVRRQRPEEKCQRYWTLPVGPRQYLSTTNSASIFLAVSSLPAGSW